MAISHVAPGCRSVNAYLMIENAASALKFYERVFGAEITI
jgi:uncharacterized glyoxalase superfamily protein PhnB